MAPGPLVVDSKAASLLISGEMEVDPEVFDSDDCPSDGESEIGVGKVLGAEGTYKYLKLKLILVNFRCIFCVRLTYDIAFFPVRLDDLKRCMFQEEGYNDPTGNDNHHKMKFVQDRLYQVKFMKFNLKNGALC